SANATILLRNLGGDAEVRVRSVGALPDGWRVALDPPSVLLRAAGARNESGATLDEASVRAEVLAPRGAPVGLSVPLALVVEPTVGAGAAARVGLVAVAANDLALRVEGPDALLGAPASNGTARVTVRSEALAPLDLAVEPLVARDAGRAARLAGAWRGGARHAALERRAGRAPAGGERHPRDLGLRRHDAGRAPIALHPRPHARRARAGPRRPRRGARHARPAAAPPRRAAQRRQ